MPVLARCVVATVRCSLYMLDWTGLTDWTGHCMFTIQQVADLLFNLALAPLPYELDCPYGYLKYCLISTVDPILVVA